MGELVRIGDISPTTAITIPTGEGTIAMCVNDVLKWVAPTAPKGEALKFLLTCRAARVNPFLGEAHLVGMGGRYTTIIDKSGWLRQAEDNPEFDGFEAGIVIREVITPPSKDKDGNAVPGVYGKLEEHEGALFPSGYQLVGGWARVYRKGRTRPTVAKVSLSEFRKDSPNWANMPATMIRKVAVVNALREAKFLVGGAYDRDEMPGVDDESFRVTPAPPPTDEGGEAAIEVEYAEVPTHQLDLATASELQAAISAAGMTDFEVAQVLGRRGATSIAQLSNKDAREILHKLYQVIDRDRAGETLLPDPAPAADGEAVDVEFVEA